MNYLVPILALIASGILVNYLYYKTNISKFVINKLKINTKLKCNILYWVFFVLGISFFLSSIFTYKNVVHMIILFVIVSISMLFEFIKREIV